MRQGNPLSRYLFVICVEVLTQMLTKAIREQKLNYHPKCAKIKLSHLCFVDDLMIFFEVYASPLQGIKMILDTFKCISSLGVG